MTKLGKVLAAVIDSGTINRAEHPIWHIGRTRDLEKMSSGEALAVHGWRFTVCGWRFAVCSWRFAVGGLQLAVCSWRLGVASSSFMADLWGGSDGTYRTNETNGNHMTSLLNKKPAAVAQPQTASC